MDEAITALKAHLDSKVSKYGVQTVKLYAGEFADADKIDSILPAVLIAPPTMETTRTKKRMEFSLLIVTETLGYNRERNAELNLLTAWRIYHWLKNNPVFSDSSNKFIIGVKDDIMPLRARVAAFTWRHVVVEIEMTIWKN